MSSPSTTSESRAWVEVDLEALGANLARVQRAVGADTGLIPMVKADAYGLGAEAVCSAIARRLAAVGGPWAFGVAAVAEGEQLRCWGWTGRVLVFSPVTTAEMERAARAGLTLCLSDLDSLRAWRDAARGAGRRLAFHTEVDTGMGRAGFAWQHVGEWAEAVARLAAEAVQWEGCYTHFHSADEPDLAPTHEQWARFQSVAAALPPPPAGDPPRRLHVANSAAALRCAGYGCDLVRPGITLYGGDAGPGTSAAAVAAVRARLVLVRDVEPGSTVGYGATYRARRRERWGTLAIGYADGVRRRLAAGGGQALIHGRRVPIIGRVSMDMTTVDLTDVPEAQPGDVVTLIGADGDAEIRLDEVARRCDTIAYEILVGLGKRLPRVYRPGPDEVGADGDPRELTSPADGTTPE